MKNIVDQISLQALFCLVGGEKRPPEIRLRSQAIFCSVQSYVLIREEVPFNQWYYYRVFKQ